MKIMSEDEQEGLYQPSLWPNPHLWREILLNARPNARCEPFRAGISRRYWLEVNHSEAGVTMTVHYRGGRVAQAVIAWAGPDEAVLEDILVASSCRKRGLATHLLDRAVILVGQHGARRLTGRVIRKDAELIPALLDWYKRRGFEIEAVQDASSAGPSLPLSRVAQRSQPQWETVATICLKLEHYLAGGRH